MARVFLLLTAFLTFAFCVILFLTKGFVSYAVFANTFILVLITSLLIILYLSSQSGSIISPIGYFILSLLVFVLARPIIGLFLPMQYVEAGFTESYVGVVETVAWIGIGLAFIAFGFGLVKPNYVIDKLSQSSLCFPKSRLIYILLVVASIGLLIAFLIVSYQKSKIFSELNYLDALNDQLHSHFFLFFIAKNLVLISLFFHTSQRAVLFLSLLVFIGSIGFLILGLRGYTVAYFFLFMFFLNERWAINKVVLLGIMVGLVYIAGVVLEYRVGHAVYDGLGDLIFKVIHQQGATFEVIYGVVNYLNEVRSCIGYKEYFNGADFGSCVDTSRGVFWLQGGFASSFYAEALYLGWGVYIVLCFLIGSLLKVLDVLTFLRRLRGASADFSSIFLFAIIPNLVYFSRASAFDLIVKFCLLWLILFMVSALWNIFRPKYEVHS
ncbi:O-antigen polysaccharide polymerase Wzy [Pseudomonas sp. TUM22785]|uniref:O-antigen polysaccharide polymerase Wzy n=1 Tax=Pseudomonas sp. TUM22785 TaxID=3019098 RepID=UPI00230629EE|nr:O-antigen polysaccharide polymerase Wzy [Pseudomonas sp. TUM22785]WCD82150.1 O-antigen polysaccharide polymerase Wzy [Pseudomonas sp. TUM22785]